MATQLQKFIVNLFRLAEDEILTRTLFRSLQIMYEISYPDIL